MFDQVICLARDFNFSKLFTQVQLLQVRHLKIYHSYNTDIHNVPRMVNKWVQEVWTLIKGWVVLKHVLSEKGYTKLNNIMKLLYTNYSTLYFSGSQSPIWTYQFHKDFAAKKICICKAFASRNTCIFLMAYLSSVHCNRADSRLAPSPWETSLQSNAVSHWLGTNLESALLQYSSSATGHVALAVITGTIILIPYLCVQSL